MRKLTISSIAILFAIISMSEINAQTADTFTDNRDGKTYKTVKIGKQIWMAENLAYKASNNCWAYDNDQSNLSQYGYLYNYEIAKNVCPDGYHLPTKAEFEALLNNYGGADNIKRNYVELIPSGKSGFIALFSGYISEPTGAFHNKDISTGFWSASAENNDDAWHLFIYSQDSTAGLTYFSKRIGFSVRCLKDSIY